MTLATPLTPEGSAFAKSSFPFLASSPPFPCKAVPHSRSSLPHRSPGSLHGSPLPGEGNPSRLHIRIHARSRVWVGFATRVQLINQSFPLVFSRHRNKREHWACNSHFFQLNSDGNARSKPDLRSTMGRPNLTVYVSPYIQESVFLR